MVRRKGPCRKLSPARSAPTLTSGLAGRRTTKVVPFPTSLEQLSRNEAVEMNGDRSRPGPGCRPARSTARGAGPLLQVTLSDCASECLGTRRRACRWVKSPDRRIAPATSTLTAAGASNRRSSCFATEATLRSIKSSLSSPARALTGSSMVTPPSPIRQRRTRQDDSPEPVRSSESVFHSVTVPAGQPLGDPQQPGERRRFARPAKTRFEEPARLPRLPACHRSRPHLPTGRAVPSA
jgi:hypothetical protein